MFNRLSPEIRTGSQRRQNAAVAVIFSAVHPELGSRNLGDDTARQGMELQIAQAEIQKLIDTPAPRPRSIWQKFLTLDWND